MTTATDQDVAAPTLPKEAERRIVEDADVRGIAVRLQGGESWYVSPLPLSPRGERIGEVMDALGLLEIDHAAAQKIVELKANAIDAATDEEAVEKATEGLKRAVAKRDGFSSRITQHREEIAYHALRSHYRVSREEAGRLVTQRAWGDVLAALNGLDTEAGKIELALQTLKAVHEITKGGGRSGDEPAPFGSRPSSDGGAAS